MPPTNSKAAPESVTVPNVEPVQKETAVKKEEGTNKPAPRNELKPAKSNDKVQGVARERR